MGEQNDRPGELYWSFRFDVPVLPLTEIAVIRSVADLSLHIQSFSIGEAVCYSLAYSIVASPIAPNVYDDTFRVFEFLDDLVDGGRAFLQPAKIPEVQVTDRITQPAVLEHIVDKLGVLALQILLLHQVQ